ncbi:MAG: hypothetical protein CVU46_16045 [Chloroflexi bacterium HGW-Chloroflexi-8]|jgi:glycosyltransferase involved in cell wall biosynthesis|nr:MAG: hypothetical protein CVU46_16045 [Chloroflexi bacterium HGW-Chloroflexi-8]
MDKKLKLGVAINDTWAFFEEIYALFIETHQTTLFRPQQVQIPLLSGRINNYLYKKSLNNFLESNSVCFFEWAGEFLSNATSQPKKSGIVTRLHRYEMYQWADKIHWENVDRVILVSQAKKIEIESRFPILMDKTIVIPEGINLNRFTFSPKPFRKQLGILCHLSPRKRVYELIIAFVEGNFHKMGYTLHIGGGTHPKFPDYALALKLLVSNLGIKDSVIFHDHIIDQTKWFDEIDIFISNSYSEGLQVSPLEAMARGRFCLSHNWDGANELLPTDYLFELNTDLIEKILTYAELSENNKLKTLQLQRQMVEEKFNINYVAKSILNVVNEVAEMVS